MQQNDKMEEHSAGSAAEIDKETQTYLRVAELVLQSSMYPLKAREIVDRGFECGYFGDHPLSRTPEKSMQARLSIDILRKQEKSKFVRTSRGRFQLRARLQEQHDGQKHTSPNTEYVATRRVLRLPMEQVLCVPESHYSRHLIFQGIDTDASSIIHPLISKNRIIPRAEAE